MRRVPLNLVEGMPKENKMYDKISYLSQRLRKGEIFVPVYLILFSLVHKQDGNHQLEAEAEVTGQN